MQQTREVRKRAGAQRPFTPSTGVQIPLGTPRNQALTRNRKGFFVMGKHAPPSILQVFGNFFSERFTLKRENARRGTTPPGPERAEKRVFPAKRQAAWFGTRSGSN